ncbi:MAG: hypothetical protein J6331_09245 [Lentisphaeria bacterium]|nr:hypothetical protein [Lentisphaeria bacterium]
MTDGIFACIVKGKQLDFGTKGQRENEHVLREKSFLHLQRSLCLRKRHLHHCPSNQPGHHYYLAVRKPTPKGNAGGFDAARIGSRVFS